MGFIPDGGIIIGKGVLLLLVIQSVLAMLETASKEETVGSHDFKRGRNLITVASEEHTT